MQAGYLAKADEDVGDDEDDESSGHEVNLARERWRIKLSSIELSQLYPENVTSDFHGTQFIHDCRAECNKKAAVRFGQRRSNILFSSTYFFSIFAFSISPSVPIFCSVEEAFSWKSLMFAAASSSSRLIWASEGEVFLAPGPRPRSSPQRSALPSRLPWDD